MSAMVSSPAQVHGSSMAVRVGRSKLIFSVSVVVVMTSVWTWWHRRRRRVSGFSLPVLPMAPDVGRSEEQETQQFDIENTTAFRDRMLMILRMPLFRRFRQSEHPLLAQAMRLEVWAPGAVVTKDGDNADTFWIVNMGTATTASTLEASAKQNEEAEADSTDDPPNSMSIFTTKRNSSASLLGNDTLIKGDYFGAYNSRSGDFAGQTIVAGPDGLSTLSLSILELEELGIFMHVPRRQAIIAAIPSFSSECSDNDLPPKTEEQRAFLMSALFQHFNPAFGLEDEQLGALADLCEFQTFQAGEVVMVQGQMEQTVIIVEDGKLSMVDPSVNATPNAQIMDERWALPPIQNATPSELHVTPTASNFPISRVKSDFILCSPAPTRSVKGWCQVDEGFSNQTVLSHGDVAGIREAVIGEANAATIVAEELSILWTLPRAAIFRALDQRRLDEDKIEHVSVENIARKEFPALPTATELNHVCRLGRGSYGLVSLVRQERPNKPEKLYALKTIFRRDVTTEIAKQHVRNEHEVMKVMESDFIVQFHGTYRDSEHICFLLEAALGGDLFTVLDRDRRQVTGNLGFMRFVAASVSLALQHMHTRRVIYRDLKPENVLFDSEGHVKICDLGLAKLCIRSAHTLCGTPEYMAPEVLKHRGYNHMVDWWALGVLCYELVSGRQPFLDGGEDLMGVFKAIQRGMGNVRFDERRFDKPSEELVRGLCADKPSNRLGFKKGLDQIRDHVFFDELNWHSMALGEYTPPLKPPVRTLEDCDEDNTSEGRETMSVLGSVSACGEVWELTSGVLL